MNSIEQHVTSLDLSKRLAGLGVKAEPIYWWNTWGDNNGNPYITTSTGGLVSEEVMRKDYLVPAYLASELAGMLPNSFVYEDNIVALAICKHDELWEAVYDNPTLKMPVHRIFNKSLPDTLGLMLAHLLETGAVGLQDN